MPVVATLEFYDLFAASEPPGHPDSGHRGFSARVYEPHLFHARKCLNEKSRQLGLKRGRRAKASAPRSLLTESLYDLRVGVTKY